MRTTYLRGIRCVARRAAQWAARSAVQLPHRPPVLVSQDAGRKTDYLTYNELIRAFGKAGAVPQAGPKGSFGSSMR